MANPHKGELTFEADGKTYTLQYSHDALVELEEQLDRGIFSIIREIERCSSNLELVRLGMVRAIFWAGLHEHHPDLDIKAAGELMTKAGGLLKVLSLASEGLVRAFGAPETKGSRPPKRMENGIGTSSSSTTSVPDLPLTSSGN